MRFHLFSKSLTAFGVCVLLAGCNGGGAGTNGFIPSGNPFPPGSHLYVANNIFSTQAVSVYTSPFSSATTPSGSISSGVGNDIGVAVDPTDSSGKVYVGSGTLVAVYARPSPSGGSPLFNVSGGGMTEAEFENFDASGNLYVASPANHSVFVISKPISAASTPTALALTSPGVPTCAAVDPAGNLYELDGTAGSVKLNMYGPAHSGAAVASTTNGVSSNAQGCAIDPVTHRIYIATSTSGGAVVGYATPLTSGAAPVVTLTFPGLEPTGIGFDANGTLYVNVLDSGTITSVIDAFAQPITTGSPGPIAVTFPNGFEHSAQQLATGP